MHEILQKLTGGDFRSTGRSEEVVEDVIRDPSLFAVVFHGMLSDDPLIRMRSADAIEKITSATCATTATSATKSKQIYKFACLP